MENKFFETEDNSIKGCFGHDGISIPNIPTLDEAFGTFNKGSNCGEDKKTETEFGVITRQMEETYNAKNKDYGSSFDHNLDKWGLVAAAIPLSNKMNRIESLIKNRESMVSTESIEDTLLDMANYAIMTVMWMRKQ